VVHWLSEDTVKFKGDVGVVREIRKNVTVLLMSWLRGCRLLQQGSCYARQTYNVVTITASVVGTNIEIHNQGLPGEDEIQSFCLDVGRITGNFHFSIVPMGS